MIWTQSYYPYGNRYINYDHATQNGLWFTGKPTEDSTGLSYYGARWYNPAIGRFYGTDPQGFKDSSPLSINRYAYANNNPYRFTDPSGESPLDIGFLAIDLVRLGVAVGNGENIGETAIDVGLSVIGVVAPIPLVGEALKGVRLAEGAARIANRLGKEGEEAVRAVYEIGEKPKALLPINGRLRRPDGLTAETISEIKNVKYQAFTQQLRDYADFAFDNGLRFDLYLRDVKAISKPLAEAYESGRVNLLPIP